VAEQKTSSPTTPATAHPLTNDNDNDNGPPPPPLPLISSSLSSSSLNANRKAKYYRLPCKHRKLMLKPAPRRLVKLQSICEGVRFEREVTVIEHDGHYADEEFAAGESRLITMYS
jgi:hypothetical protein